MKLQDPEQTTVLNEIDLLLSELPLRNACVLELGCGRAEKTRALAKTGLPQAIVALEVDKRQHAKNLQLGYLPNVTFVYGGAESIPFEDESFDAVMMFKSLHHVPIPLMGTAISEIWRILRPDGVAWISEPVFAGDFNEVMRLFHDEEMVRKAAFSVVSQAVTDGMFSLRKQLFFNVRNRFDDFDDFSRRMIRVTHSTHNLSTELLAKVRTKFESFMTQEGAQFFSPERVDLLVKNASLKNESPSFLRSSA